MLVKCFSKHRSGYKTRSPFFVCAILSWFSKDWGDLIRFTASIYVVIHEESLSELVSTIYILYVNMNQRLFINFASCTIILILSPMRWLSGLVIPALQQIFLLYTLMHSSSAIATYTIFYMIEKIFRSIVTSITYPDILEHRSLCQLVPHYSVWLALVARWVAPRCPLPMRTDMHFSLIYLVKLAEMIYFYIKRERERI